MTAPAPADAAAMLDPKGGRIVGFARGAAGPGRGGAGRGETGRGGAARVDLMLDGVRVRTCLAAASAETLGEAGFARLGPPPAATCAFEMRLPADAAGERLVVACGGREILSADVGAPGLLARYREGAVMTDSVTIENVRLEEGVLKARLIDHAGEAQPVVTIRTRGEAIGEARLTPEGAGRWAVAAPLDAVILSDGVVIVELALADGSVAGRLPIASGAALASDLAAEVASLRAELDQLKRAFRAEIAGGVIRRDERPMIVAEALTQVDHLLEMRDRADRRQDALKGDEIWDEDDPLWDVDQ